MNDALKRCNNKSVTYTRLIRFPINYHSSGKKFVTFVTIGLACTKTCFGIHVDQSLARAVVRRLSLLTMIGQSSVLPVTKKMEPTRAMVAL